LLSIAIPRRKPQISKDKSIPLHHFTHLDRNLRRKLWRRVAEHVKLPIANIETLYTIRD
jgi:hypothetical protein